MPDDEGAALYRTGRRAASVGPLLEIGSYCGKSSVYLGAAARAGGSVLFSIDHHRGSEEHQAGEEYFDPRLVDDQGRVDTLPQFRKTIDEAGLWDTVIAVIGTSTTVARHWAIPLGLVFVDGGHSRSAAHSDFENWSRHVMVGGYLAIHDVFSDPQEGGRPPFEIYERAIDGGGFAEVATAGSLRVLQRI
ncbi:MAG: class I SAM-dependent methyltransferase [Actinomycetota bacterium]|nr:class I SAM-dependent methyltransferase [Actinomycetota bacterium]